MLGCTGEEPKIQGESSGLQGRIEIPAGLQAWVDDCLLYTKVSLDKLDHSVAMLATLQKAQGDGSSI